MRTHKKRFRQEKNIRKGWKRMTIACIGIEPRGIERDRGILYV